jgi:O-antigen/teichoic acid export membrane protein
MTRRQRDGDAKRDPEPAPGEAVGRIFTVAVICGVWMALATALGARFVVDVIAGRQGAGSIPVLRIHSLMFIVSFLFTAGALYLVSIRRYRPLLVAASSALALNVVLALVLVPDLGARGGALADVITEAVAAIGLTAVVVRAAPRQRLRPSFLAALALACAASATMLLLPIGSLAQASGATVIYFVVLLAAGAVPSEVVDAARRLGRARASA